MLKPNKIKFGITEDGEYHIVGKTQAPWKEETQQL
jgi:hypothetical protein